MSVREKLVELLTDNLPRCGNLPRWDNPLQLSCDEQVQKIADHLIMNGVTVQEWVSVKDRLPEQFVDVLCYFPEKDYGSKAEIDYMETIDGHFVSSFKWGHPTHWIPLPQPPQPKNTYITNCLHMKED